MTTDGIIVILFMASFFAAGLLEALFGEPTGLGITAYPHLFLCAVLLYAWCKAHAAQHHIEEPSGSAALCGLVGLVGVPLYFFRAYGKRIGLIKTTKALGILILSIVLSLMGSLVGIKLGS